MELKIDKPKNTLARASYDVKESSGDIGWKTGTERTLSVNPKEATLQSPLPVNVSLEEPCCSFLLTGITGYIVVGGWIWWGKPSVDVLP